MKLNLGCGPDHRPGFVNVDFRSPCDQVVDLSKLPWPFADESADEILMLDFLEHFPYRKTEQIIQEVWRVLKPGGTVDIQVPDFDHCAVAASQSEGGYLCNRCGNKIELMFGPQEFHGVDVGNEETGERWNCAKCGQHLDDCSEAAIMRLYGGQDYEGNWHFNTFTRRSLRRVVQKNGFEFVDSLEFDHQYANWNFKFRFRKKADAWGDDG